jgi:hypothetical protein
VGWFLFRARSLAMILGMLGSLQNLAWTSVHTRWSLSLALLATPVLAFEIWQYRTRDLLAPMRQRAWSFALMGGAMLVLTGAMFERFKYVFIYFQF